MCATRARSLVRSLPDSAIYEYVFGLCVRVCVFEDFIKYCVAFAFWRSKDSGERVSLVNYSDATKASLLPTGHRN